MRNSVQTYYSKTRMRQHTVRNTTRRTAVLRSHTDPFKDSCSVSMWKNIIGSFHTQLKWSHSRIMTLPWNPSYSWQKDNISSSSGDTNLKDDHSLLFTSSHCHLFHSPVETGLFLLKSRKTSDLCQLGETNQILRQQGEAHVWWPCNPRWHWL